MHDLFVKIWTFVEIAMSTKHLTVIDCKCMILGCAVMAGLLEGEAAEVT